MFVRIVVRNQLSFISKVYVKYFNKPHMFCETNENQIIGIAKKIELFHPVGGHHILHFKFDFLSPKFLPEWKKK